MLAYTSLCCIILSCHNTVTLGRKGPLMRQIPLSITDKELAQRISRNKAILPTYMAQAMVEAGIPADSVEYSGHNPSTGRVNFTVSTSVKSAAVLRMAQTLRDELSAAPKSHLRLVT